MKKRILTVIVIMALSIFQVAVAQSDVENGRKFVPNSIRVYSGESALSSGLGIACDFVAKDGSRMLSLEFNRTMSQAVYVEKRGGLFYGGSFGRHFSTMWMAPIIMYAPWDFLTFTSWNGFMFGQPNDPSWKPVFGFSYHAADFTFGNVGLGYSLLYYLQDEPVNCVSLKYTLKFDKLGLTPSATYNFRDQRPMFMVQGFYQF